MVEVMAVGKLTYKCEGCQALVQTRVWPEDLKGYCAITRQRESMVPVGTEQKEYSDEDLKDLLEYWRRTVQSLRPDEYQGLRTDLSLLEDHFKGLHEDQKVWNCQGCNRTIPY